jgi:hypothetical protein
MAAGINYAARRFAVARPLPGVISVCADDDKASCLIGQGRGRSRARSPRQSLTGD